jgi:hypothetical protein
MTTEQLDELDVLDTAAAAVALSEGRDYTLTVADARDIAFALDLPRIGRSYAWASAAIAQGHELLDQEEDAEADEEEDEDEDVDDEQDDDDGP